MVGRSTPARLTRTNTLASIGLAIYNSSVYLHNYLGIVTQIASYCYRVSILPEGSCAPPSQERLRLDKAEDVAKSTIGLEGQCRTLGGAAGSRS